MPRGRGNEGGAGATVSGAVPCAQGSGTEGEALFAKLRPGPGHSPEEVVAHQRARLHGAMIELVAERGYGGVTVRGLARLAGVSSRSFYECFANVEECFLATYTVIIRDTLRFPGKPVAVPEDRLRSRLRWFFTVLEKESKAAALVLVDAPSTGSALRVKIRGANRELERFIQIEVAAATTSPVLPKPLAHGAATAALQLARSQLLSANPASTAAVADEFADWLLGLDRGGSSALWAPDGYASWWPADPPAPDWSGVIGDERNFLIAAATKVALRDGYAELTVPTICREAGVPRRAFDACFQGVAACFLAAVEMRIAGTLARAEAHAEGAASWERGVVRVMASICGELRRDPALARLAFVEIVASGAPGVELRERTLGRWARRLRRTAPRGIRPGQLSADASVAAAAAIIAASRLKRLDRAVPRAAFAVLAPLVGSAGAEEAIVAELRVRPGASESENI